MTGAYTPTKKDPAPVWAPWVASGLTASERRHRLAQVPDALRERVENHVRAVFELKAAQKRRQAITGF